MSTINVNFADNSSSGSKGKKKKTQKKESSAIGLLIRILGTAIGGAIAYYFMLPPMNFKSLDSYIFLGLILGIYAVLTIVTGGVDMIQTVTEGGQTFNQPAVPEKIKKKLKVPAVIAIALAAVVAIGLVSSAQILRANSYSKLITVDESKTFADDFEEADFKTVPVLDIAAASVLANRTLGDLASIGKVSQFEAAYDYDRINYKDSPYIVTTLTYGDIFKWFNNTSVGLPGYIKINMVTQKAELVTLEEGKYMKYSPYEYFSKDLMRHVRFSYPTYIFDTPTFEIDESGAPYWICPILDKTIGLFGGTDVKGIVIVDAVTGEMNEYSLEDLSTNKDIGWVDSAYSSHLVVEQYDFYGRYLNGFINSIFGQEGVKVTTESSNYLAIDGDIYLYTGVTSSGNDQAIIGFVLINLRTKEANFYEVSGAKELSAMSSAQGEVQNYSYAATFPILLNISGQPTYFMSLKDADNLIRMYSMVSVQYYQVAVTGSTIAECMETYVKELEKNNIDVNIDLEEVKDATSNNENSTETDKPEIETLKTKGTISQIRTAVMDGESVFFIELDSKKTFFSVVAKECPEVVILNVGDKVTFEHEESEETIIEAKLVK